MKLKRFLLERINRKMLTEKNFDERDDECFKISDKPYQYSRCQLEVPGVGRIMTGERHPNFHLTETRKPGQIEQTKKFKIKTYSQMSRKKANAKMEIAYKRS
jgi:hypothetical protein